MPSNGDVQLRNGQSPVQSGPQHLRQQKMIQSWTADRSLRSTVIVSKTNHNLRLSLSLRWPTSSLSTSSMSTNSMSTNSLSTNGLLPSGLTTISLVTNSLPTNTSLVGLGSFNQGIGVAFTLRQVAIIQCGNLDALFPSTTAVLQ
jgi:hypothetical protein